MAAPAPLLEPTDIERELPFDAGSFADLSETDFNELLAEYARRETEQIRQWSGTAFSPTTASETLDGTNAIEDGVVILLENKPVIDVTSVTEDGDLLDPSDYSAFDHGVERLGGGRGWSDGRRNITVEYTYGYDEVPGPVKQALVRLVRLRFDQIATDGLESEKGPDTSYDYTDPEKIRAECYRDVKSSRPESYHGGGTMI